MYADDLQDWLPWRLKKQTDDLLCDWLYTGSRFFSEPFFDDTIAACRQLPENRMAYKAVSDLEIMSYWSPLLETVQPTAIIFHVSRCGSTLFSQLLNCDDQNIVLSEVPFFDEMLRLPYKNTCISSSFVDTCLGAALGFYGRRKTAKQHYLFIKTDSWHLHFYEHYRSLFPSIPFIILYRNPLEVIYSQQKQRGLQSVPGLIEPAVFGFTNAEIGETDLNRYMTKVLVTYFRKVLEIVAKNDQTIICNYDEGILGITKRLYQLLGLTLDKEVEMRFEERCRFHAKQPRLEFVHENVSLVRQDYMEDVMTLYDELEDKRIRSLKE